MAYPACSGEYVVFEGDGEVGDCPRPIEGRQLTTVDIAEIIFLDVYLEPLLLLLALRAATPSVFALAFFPEHFLGVPDLLASLLDLLVPVLNLFLFVDNLFFFVPDLLLVCSCLSL